jgi:hypothetical protein
LRALYLFSSSSVMGRIICCSMAAFSRDCAAQRFKIAWNSPPRSVQIVRRHFSRLMQMNHHLADAMRQHRWCASVCISESASHVCWTHSMSQRLNRQIVFRGEPALCYPSTFAEVTLARFLHFRDLV